MIHLLLNNICLLKDDKSIMCWLVGISVGCHGAIKTIIAIVIIYI